MGTCPATVTATRPPIVTNSTWLKFANPRTRYERLKLIATSPSSQAKMAVLTMYWSIALPPRPFERDERGRRGDVSHLASATALGRVIQLHTRRAGYLILPAFVTSMN